MSARRGGGRCLTSKFNSICDTESAVATVFEINWHWKGGTPQGISSIDFHPCLPRFVTAGYDGSAKVWKLVDSQESAAGDVEFISVLEARGMTVRGGCSAARWSPVDGNMIAAALENHVLLFRPSSKRPVYQTHQDIQDATEYWTEMKRWMTRQDDDVLALAWSPDQSLLLGGTAKGGTMIWKIDGPGGASEAAPWTIRMSEHTAQVCGIAVDPLGVELASLGEDARINFYSHRAASASAAGTDQFRKLGCFGSSLARGLLEQDKLRTYQRPASYSPDGLYLLVAGAFKKVKKPKQQEARKRSRQTSEEREEAEQRAALEAAVAGTAEKDQNDPMADYVDVYGCQVWLRGAVHKEPMGFIPAPRGLTPTTVKWCPRFFEPVEEQSAMSHLFGTRGYRMVFAVACKPRYTATAKVTLASVLLYDTVHAAPLLFVKNMHSLAVTDLSWCPTRDGLLSSGRDGYISALMFKEGTLGPKLAESGDGRVVVRCAAKRKEILRRRSAQMTVKLAQREMDKSIKRRRLQEEANQQRLTGGAAAAENGEPDAAAAPAPPPPGPVMHVLAIKKKKPKPEAEGAAAAVPQSAQAEMTQRKPTLPETKAPPLEAAPQAAQAVAPEPSRPPQPSGAAGREAATQEGEAKPDIVRQAAADGGQAAAP